MPRARAWSFSDVHEAHRAYESRMVDLQAKVRVRVREYALVDGKPGAMSLRTVQTTDRSRAAVGDPAQGHVL